MKRNLKIDLGLRRHGEHKTTNRFFIIPNIPLNIKLYKFDNFYTDDGMGLVIDRFEDELFLAFNNNNKVNILTACSHRGITNICEVAMNQFKSATGNHYRWISPEKWLH
jgi:7,8-dihydropterin-6-yl-methyl-4-(beta-D-ribofuranosyl)aminobenzene 5'-phosphate synthase